MAGVSIFYDLETSDREPIGQILNFCFRVVDGKWNELRTLSGEIRISRLQLPSPGAILTNRINVLEHQRSARLNEAQAARQIDDFFKEVISAQRGSAVDLVGYNSNRFDLPFLRTTLIRNGYNPYYGGKLSYRDLFQLTRQLYIRNSNFPDCIKNQTADGQPKLDLSLSNVAQLHGLLTGKQAHTSVEDVALTIKLAQEFVTRYKADVRSADTFEVRKLLSLGRGSIVSYLTPNYDAPHTSRYTARPFVLVDADPRQTLWVDLERYRPGQGRGSIKYLNASTHPFFTDGGWPSDPEVEGVAARATQEFKAVTTRNFFETSSCDIEQDIYRLPMDDHQLLGRVIAGEAAPTLLNTDGRRLLTRYKMANASNVTPALEKRLADYARYRYGGELKLVKWETTGESSERQQPTHHPTLGQLRAEIEAGLKSAPQPEDTALLQALKDFYDNSEIVRLVGAELGLARAA